MRLTSAFAVLAALLAACAPFQPALENANTFVLDARPTTAAPGPRHDVVVAVSQPRARPGFDSAQIAYVRRSHELDYFAKSRWADTPPRMLAPLLAQALDQSGSVRAVVQAPSTAAADVRLDVEIVRLVQDFSNHPSRVRFSLRVQLIDLASRRVLATREFEGIENAPSDDAYGGVVAANRALERLLTQVAVFCAEQVAGRAAR